MRVRAQTVGKEEPLFPDNEDAFRVDTESHLWAIADGAGGGGIFAGEWANYVAQHVPKVPFSDFSTFSAWTERIWEPFFVEYENRATSNPLRLNKFLSEGSYTTLATLHLTGNHAHWTTYGDAVVLVWHRKTGLRSSLTDLRAFTTGPYLLNWNNAPRPDGFQHGQWPHRTGQRYALLTDTLAQYVLMAYDALLNAGVGLRLLAHLPIPLGERASRHLNHWNPETHRFGRDVWAPLARSLRNPVAFLTYTRALAARHLLGPDDYTMVLIEPNQTIL